MLADGGEQQQIQRPDVVTAATQRDPEHWRPARRARQRPARPVTRPVPPKSAFWVMSAILASARKTAMADGSAPPDPPQVHRDIQAAAYAALA